MVLETHHFASADMYDNKNILRHDLSLILYKLVAGVWATTNPAVGAVAGIYIAGLSGSCHFSRKSKKLGKCFMGFITSLGLAAVELRMPILFRLATL
jgi:hypothetical protein